MRLILAVLMGLMGAYAEHALGCRITPIEALFRPLLRGPLMSKTASASNQFAGRTTISSGSVSATVSTFSVNSDSLIFAVPQCAMPAGYNTKGLIQVLSGISTGVASTTALYSGAVVELSWIGVNAPQGGPIRVQSIVNNGLPGGSFTIALTSATISSGAAIAYEVPSAEPSGIVVSTISPKGFFTLGWADQQPRPIDVAVMWEIRRTS